MAECDWIVLCDYAFQGHLGKVCLIGIFDLIFAPDTPIKHERAFIGFSVIGEPGENVLLKLEIIGPKGESLGKVAREFTLPDSGSAQVALEMKDLMLKNFGRHAIQIDLGDGQPKSAWFTLKQSPKQNPEQ
jgi:hypothetical protein